jgi:hypothetical protein
LLSKNWIHTALAVFVIRLMGAEKELHVGRQQPPVRMVRGGAANFNPRCCSPVDIYPVVTAEKHRILRFVRPPVGRPTDDGKMSSSFLPMRRPAFRPSPQSCHPNPPTRACLYMGSTSTYWEGQAQVYAPGGYVVNGQLRTTSSAQKCGGRRLRRRRFCYCCLDYLLPRSYLDSLVSLSHSALNRLRAQHKIKRRFAWLTPYSEATSSLCCS